MSNILSRWFERRVNEAVTKRVQLILTDRDGFHEQGGGREERDRPSYDREEVLHQCLEAWRVNPLARRVVALTTQFAVGSGVSLNCAHPATQTFLQNWWNHRLNQMPLRLVEWCDELTRSGELFILVSTGSDGMSYLRAIPALAIAEIKTAENDSAQETAFIEKDSLYGTLGELREGRVWQAYDPAGDAPGEGGSFAPVMLHYAVNRPAGALHGESDLAPVLKWLGRYTQWLEDRARLNRFRQTFLFQVKARYASEAERAARQAALNTSPPSPGSILVTDESENWSVLAPELDGFEASQDGMALKKMIAAGMALPLHFLAEPESSTRTTAESAGLAVFKHLEQRQQLLHAVIRELAGIAIRRRALVDRRVKADAEVSVSGVEVSLRDHTALAGAAKQALDAFGALRERGLIDDRELLRVVYRFAGETVDVEKLLGKGI
ncbi:MAG: hypothetical protein WCF08_02980 [Anaerolineaceae bacterium]